MLLTLLLLPIFFSGLSSHVSINNFHLKLEPFELDEYLNGSFADRGWNGTWVSDSIFVVKDQNNSLYQVDVVVNKAYLFLDASVFNDYPGNSLTFSYDLKYALIKYNEKAVFRHSRTAQYTVYDIINREYYHLHSQNHLQYAVWAPIGDGLVYVYNNNIYYVSSISDARTPRQITTDGEPGIIYNGVPDWVYEEEVLGSGSALWISPNGKRLAFVHFNDTEVLDFHYFLYGELRDQYPTVVTLKYPKVGTTNPTILVKYVDLDNTTAEVVNLTNIIPLNIVTQDHVLQDMKWANNSDIVAVSLNRVQNTSVITRCNVETNHCYNVYTHNVTNGWVELQTPIFNKDGTKSLVLISESEDNDHYKHLSIVNGNDFSHRTRLTYGKRIVSSVYGWDESRSLIYYVGTVEGNHAQQQVYVVNVTSKTDRCLTCDFVTPEGVCKVSSASFSKGFSYFAKTCSGPGPKFVQVENLQDLHYFNWEDNSELRQRLLKKLTPIHKNIKVPLSSGYSAYVRLLLPPDFDENSMLQYPLIVNVYGGPNSNQISDAYSAGVENYFVTNRNYIYAYIDGRGSGKLGDNFMFEIYRKFGTVEIDDQIEITKYLQDNYNFIDSFKTGIWGWSYGGFATLAVLVRDTKNVFKWGLAVAPVTNFMLYDSIYTERYMALPTELDNLGGYNNTDISRSVEALRKKLFYIIHGNADDNVHFQQSMLLAKALQRADIMYFQQSYPDENHGLGSVSRHLYHTIDKFFDHGFRSERHGRKWKLTKNKKLKVKKY